MPRSILASGLHLNRVSAPAPGEERSRMKKKELQSQLEALQSQVAFQDDTLQALQSALATQQQDLLTMQRQLTLLKQRQDEQAQDAGEGSQAPTHEVPPHY